MGSGTATWLGQVLLGSTAVKVLHASPSSVLISHNPPVEGAAKALYGTDGSRGADLALELLIGFVGPKRAAVEVVSVVRPNMGLGPETLLSGRRLRGAEQARSHRDAERVVTRATELLDQAGFAATGEILVGRPTEQLLKAANGVGTSLVVVGSRGLDTLDRAVLGSVSDTVARHARATLVARKRNKGG
jgi:nucleotide-binding universal stress UspA family protein